MKFEIKRDECTGCGYCAELCPNNFRMSGPHGTSEILGASTSGFEGIIKELAEKCPGQAIVWEEE